MVSKSEIKLITSLHQKKYRNKHQLFMVEGLKGVKEFIKSDFKLYKVFATEQIEGVTTEFAEGVSVAEMKKMSALKTPSTVLAVFYMHEPVIGDEEGLTLVLDAIRDPGNLGTIIRLCDWFGIRQLVCSENTVDCYNPKVVQATMGSLGRVSITYQDISKYLQETPKSVYCATMDGANVYTTELPNEAVLVMGNEANGISESILSMIKNEISIPQFGQNQETESLNVATATAILLSEFRRRGF